MFKNREEAGEFLAKKLTSFANDRNAIILGVTRGGVVVARTIADKLNLPLDIIVVKKLSLPSEKELAVGAIGPAKTIYWNNLLIERLGIKKTEMSELAAGKKMEQANQEKILRGERSPLTKKNKKVIVVDDGVATGASAICASLCLKREGASEKILATPLISKDTLDNISRYFDRVIFLESPEDFFAVGEFYRDFPQITDEEVIRIMKGL